MKVILFKPFEKFRENQLFIFGTFFLLLGTYIATFCHANYDGAIDIHFSNYQLTFTELLTENLINISVLFLCLFLAGIYRYKKTKTIDILNIVLISRVPFYFLALFNVNNSLSVNSSIPINELMDFAMEHLFLLITMTIVMILVVIWMFALLYNGYKTATNAKGNVGLALFIAAIVVAEILSKLIIYSTIL